MTRFILVICIYFLISAIVPLIFLIRGFQDKKVNTKLLVGSLVISLITLCGVLTDISFKSDIINIFFISAFPLFIFMIYGMARSVIMKILYGFLIATPIFFYCTSQLISTLLRDYSASSYLETLDDGRYKVRALVKSWDNNKENVEVSIYKEIALLPFMESLVYQSTNVNEHIEKAEYNQSAISLFKVNNNYQWVEIINVDQ